MKHIMFTALLIITLLATIPASLGAQQGWDQSLELARYDNIKFSGSSSSYQIPGGGYFLFWRGNCRGYVSYPLSMVYSGS